MKNYIKNLQLYKVNYSKSERSQNQMEIVTYHACKDALSKNTNSPLTFAYNKIGFVNI